jgi:PhnB protein
MSLTTTTHLNFRGQAREALEFYRSAFGGEMTVVTFGDAHAAQDPAEADQVMWGQVESPTGFRVMAFDVPGIRPFDRGVDAVFVSVRSDDPDELTAIWATLKDGATIRQDLGPAQWSPLYGMLDDRFGITWVMDAQSA